MPSKAQQYQTTQQGFSCLVYAEHKKCTTAERHSLHQKCLGFHSALVSPAVKMKWLALMCLSSV